jgi:hypothetical protein
VNRNPSPRVVATALRTLGIITAALGLAASGYYISLDPPTQMTPVLGVVGVVGSVLAGGLLFSFGQMFRCLMDIEVNTRARLVAEPAPVLKATEANGKPKETVVDKVRTSRVRSPRRTATPHEAVPTPSPTGGK